MIGYDDVVSGLSLENKSGISENRCPDCRGTGAVEARFPVAEGYPECPTCGGSGDVPQLLGSGKVSPEKLGAPDGEPSDFESSDEGPGTGNGPEGAHHTYDRPDRQGGEGERLNAALSPKSLPADLIDRMLVRMDRLADRWTKQAKKSLDKRERATSPEKQARWQNRADARRWAARELREEVNEIRGELTGAKDGPVREAPAGAAAGSGTEEAFSGSGEAAAEAVGPADLIDRAVQDALRGVSGGGMASGWPIGKAVLAHIRREVEVAIRQQGPLLVEHGRQQRWPREALDAAEARGVALEKTRWETRIEKQAAWEDRARDERRKVAGWHENSGSSLAKEMREDEFRHEYTGRVLRSLLTEEEEA